MDRYVKLELRPQIQMHLNLKLKHFTFGNPVFEMSYVRIIWFSRHNICLSINAIQQ